MKIGNSSAISIVSHSITEKKEEKKLLYLGEDLRSFFAKIHTGRTKQLKNIFSSEGILLNWKKAKRTVGFSTSLLDTMMIY